MDEAHHNMIEMRSRNMKKKHSVESAVNAIRSGTLLQSALKNHNEKKFVPGRRAGHKAPKDTCSGVQCTAREI